MGFKDVIEKVGSFADEHAPELLKGAGIAGTITALILAAKFAPKAQKALEEAKEKKGEEQLTTWEKVKTTGKYYIPVVLTEALSLGCFAFGDHIGNKRTAVLATAYAISENALKKYTEKVIEVVGDKKELAVRSLVDKDAVQANPINKTEIVVTSQGNHLCFDSMSGRYFKSNKQRIDDVVNYINRDLRDEMYVPLNEFYSKLGLEEVDSGDLLGWNIDVGYLTVKYSTQQAEDGTPALVLNYSVTPKYNYR